MVRNNLKSFLLEPSKTKEFGKKPKGKWNTNLGDEKQ